MNYAEESLKKHYEWKGKLEYNSRVPVKNKEDLSLAYTPGVAQPCLEIQKDVNKSYYLVKIGNYYVLSNKEHNIGDLVKYRGEEYTISEVHLTYEDKLVTPLEKMYWLDDEDNI